MRLESRRMKNALAPVATLLFGVAILLTGLGLQGTLLPVRASLEEFSTLSIGVIGAAYFFGFTVGCLKGGELVKNVGHVRVFLAMTALASASPLVHGLILNPVVWSLLRILTGFCFAVLFVVIESWLNELVLSCICLMRGHRTGSTGSRISTTINCSRVATRS